MGSGLIDLGYSEKSVLIYWLSKSSSLEEPLEFESRLTKGYQSSTGGSEGIFSNFLGWEGTLFKHICWIYSGVVW